MYIVAGVTSAGKTTFIQSGHLGLDIDKTINACQLTSNSPPEVKDNSIIHYNILRPAEFIREDNIDYYNFDKDPIFSFIEDHAGDLTAVIIIPKDKELRERVIKRGDTEEGSYTSKWLSITGKYNLKEIYERFILHMEKLNIPCRFYLSSNGSFREVHRYSARRILEDRNTDSLSTIGAKFKNKFEYQSLRLDHSVSTSGQNRAASFLDALALDLDGKKVLDVGSAIGGLSFSAEQVGASYVVGLEPKPHRFNASVKVRDAIGSDCKFYNETLASYGLQEDFDHIFVLNVMHHMPDPIHDLRTLASKTNETLTLEFPDLTDHKYLDTFEGKKNFGDSPLIGISTRAKDQTFVFSPEGIRRIMMDHMNEFSSYKVWDSPMTSSRHFMRFIK